MEPTGLKVVGCIAVFVRLTCFGKLIVTPFHLGGGCDGGGSAFFGGGEDKPEMYHCTEVGTGPRSAARNAYQVCQPPPICQWPVWNKPCQDVPCCDVPPPCCKELAPMPVPAVTGAPGGGGGGGGRECLCAEDPCPAPCAPTRRKPKPCKEIGAEINGHALTIRVVKNKDLEQDEMVDNADNCCAISVPSSCPCSTKGSSSSPGGPGFFVQLPQKDGKPVSYNLRNCLAEDKGGDCLEQSEKPRDNFVLRIGKGKSHLELELQTPKKEGPRPLADTLSRDTQYVAAEAGPPINFYVGKRCKGRRGKK